MVAGRAWLQNHNTDFEHQQLLAYQIFGKSLHLSELVSLFAKHLPQSLGIKCCLACGVLLRPVSLQGDLHEQCMSALGTGLLPT